MTEERSTGVRDGRRHRDLHDGRSTPQASDDPGETDEEDTKECVNISINRMAISCRSRNTGDVGVVVFTLNLWLIQTAD